MDSDSTNYSRIRSLTNKDSNSNPKFQIEHCPPNVNSMPKLIMIFLLAVVIVLILFIIITFIQLLLLNSKATADLPQILERNVTLNQILQSKEQIDSQMDNQLNEDEVLLRKTNNFNEISSILIEEIRHIKAKLSPHYRHFMDQLVQSSIILNKDELVSLIKWLPQSNLTTPENITLNLLYKGSRDGDQLEDIHSRVDHKSPLVVIVKTKEDHFRFGAFTMETFYSNQPVILVNDPYTFFFSFDAMKSYDINNYFTGINTGSNVFFNFGNVFIVKPNWKNERNQGFLTYTYCLELTDERFPYKKTMFTPEEIEVYQVNTVIGQSLDA